MPQEKPARLWADGGNFHLFRSALDGSPRAFVNVETHRVLLGLRLVVDKAFDFLRGTVLPERADGPTPEDPVLF